MKTILVVVGLVVMIVLISTCSSVDKPPTIICKGPWAGGSVAEIPIAESVPPGTAGMIVKVTIKTHPTGLHLIETKSHMHGKAGFPFVVTVDDNTFEWHDDGHLETLPSCDENGNQMPEGGEGMRYSIDKKLRLSPGQHRVTLVLPSEKQTIMVSAELAADGRPYTLEFRPVYNGPETRRFGFRYGIVKFSAFLNGAPLPRCRR